MPLSQFWTIPCFTEDLEGVADFDCEEASSLSAKDVSIMVADGRLKWDVDANAEVCKRIKWHEPFNSKSLEFAFDIFRDMDSWTMYFDLNKSVNLINFAWE